MRFKALSLILVTSVFLTGCSLLPGQETQEDTQMMEQPAMEDSAGTMPAGEAMDADQESMVGGDAMVGEEDAMMEKHTEVALTMSNFTFGQDEIRVKQGEKLVLSVTNSEGVHDIVIDELGVNSGIIPEGETQEVTIPTDQPGTYEYYCSVGQHRQLGMVGTLIIE